MTIFLLVTWVRLGLALALIVLQAFAVWRGVHARARIMAATNVTPAAPILAGGGIRGDVLRGCAFTCLAIHAAVVLSAPQAKTLSTAFVVSSSMLLLVMLLLSVATLNTMLTRRRALAADDAAALLLPRPVVGRLPL